jgi:glycosyltransferase involved in cell wall biosynthesis
MKIVVFAENKQADKINAPFVEVAKKVYKEECLVWDSSCQKDLEYFAQNKDNRIYEKVLDYCYENDVEYLFIVYLHHPEYLIAELNVRNYKGSSLKTKIIYGSDWRLATISDARIKALADLLREPCVYKMVNYSNIGERATYPKSLCWDMFWNNPKVILSQALLYADVKRLPQEEARKKFNLPLDKFIYLFFGTMYYGKGLDILLNAMKKIEDRNILLFVSAASVRINYDLNFEDLKQENVIWNPNRVEDEEISYLFSACDAVVMPYRKTYLNCGSSVLTQSCQAHKPSIVPNITPYQDLSMEHGLGVRFNVEDANSLALAMIDLRNNYSYFKNSATYDDYICKIPSWEEFITNLFK